MSITVSTDVFCDACTDWVHGATGVKSQAREARRVAKAQGWVRRDQPPGSGRYVDLCPECSLPSGTVGQANPQVVADMLDIGNDSRYRRP